MQHQLKAVYYSGCHNRHPSLMECDPRISNTIQSISGGERGALLGLRSWTPLGDFHPHVPSLVYHLQKRSATPALDHCACVTGVCRWDPGRLDDTVWLLLEHWRWQVDPVDRQGSRVCPRVWPQVSQDSCADHWHRQNHVAAVTSCMLHLQRHSLK